MAIKSLFQNKNSAKNKKKDNLLDNLPHNAGTYGYDPWGFNVDGLKEGMGLSKFLHDNFFRVEAFGLENIPKEGRALIISNHSGQLPLDGVMIGHSMLTNPHAPRAPKAMVERFLPKVPFIGNYLNSFGAVVGDPTNCQRMLEKEEAIIVFPEGVRGSSKVFKYRYRLQRFGNGFMRLALKNKAPIIPVGVVGCEESIVSFADLKTVGKVFGMPSFPVILPMVFPTKVYIHFGKPLYFDQEDGDRESDITDKVELVKTEIRNLIDLGLNKRKRIFEK